jgi:hypothetical protein
MIKVWSQTQGFKQTKIQYSSPNYENLGFLKKTWADPVDLNPDFYPEVRTKTYITLGMRREIENVG